MVAKELINVILVAMASDALDRKKKRIVLDLEELAEEVRDFDVSKKIELLAHELEHIYIPWSE